MNTFCFIIGEDVKAILLLLLLLLLFSFICCVGLQWLHYLKCNFLLANSKHLSK